MIGSMILKRNIKNFSSKVRFMSGGHDNAKEEVDRWFKLTVVMCGLSSLFLAYNYVAHGHEHEGKSGLPYQKFRNKPFHWSCPDCTLFDMPCWKACKDAKKGITTTKESHH